MPAQDINRSLRYSHLGLEFVGITGGVFVLGHVADGKLGTSPTLAFVGLMVGFGLAFWRLYKGIYGPGGVAGPRPDGPPGPSEPGGPGGSPGGRQAEERGPGPER